jgi:hypothetical protein
MAVYTRTYEVSAGVVSVTDAALAFCTPLSVSRSRKGLTLVDAAPVEEQFTYNEGTGEFAWDPDNPINDGGETVIIIYKSGIVPPPPPEPPPVLCDYPVSVTLEEISGYRMRVTLPSAGNYTVRIMDTAVACGGTALETGVIIGGTFYETMAYPNGTYAACVYRDCGGGNISPDTRSNDVTIAIPVPDNFGAWKVPASTAIKLLSVGGLAVTLSSGTYPLVTTNQAVSGRHEGFTGIITVTVALGAFGHCVIGLYKNGPQIEFKTAVRGSSAGNVTVNFTSRTYLSTDDIFVILDLS